MKIRIQTQKNPREDKKQPKEKPENYRSIQK